LGREREREEWERKHGSTTCIHFLIRKNYYIKFMLVACATTTKFMVTAERLRDREREEKRECDRERERKMLVLPRSLMFGIFCTRINCQAILRLSKSSH